MKVKVEVIRLRAVRINETATVEVEVPDVVPEDERTGWILNRLMVGKVEVPQSEFETIGESVLIDYDRVLHSEPRD